MPQLAADALEAGHDGPALRRLAGFGKPTSSEIGDLFTQTLHEIGNIRIRSSEQAVVFLSRMTASDIVEGRLDPMVGAELLATYAHSTDFPPFLTPFLGLAELPVPKPTIVEIILEEAHTLLATLPE
jgi:hypothetical protein